jgi:hypothetical protein
MHPGILEHAFIAVTDQYRGVCAFALKVYYDYIAEVPTALKFHITKANFCLHVVSHEYPLHERKVSQLMSTNPHTSPQKTKAIPVHQQSKRSDRLDTRWCITPCRSNIPFQRKEGIRGE